MYVSVDKENLVFMHKHSVQKVVSYLADIEAPDVHTVVMPCDSPLDFKGFTDLELNKLYRNTTGSTHPGFYRSGLEALCAAAAAALPETKAVAWECELQAKAIPAKDTAPYRYVYGSTAPAPVGELFKRTALRTTLTSEQEAKFALQRATLPHSSAPATAAGIGGTAAPRPLAGATVAAAPRAAAIAPAAPRGGQRELIWAHADAAWQQAGSPKDVSKVLVLRKRMMDELEQQGVKRTSASSELGNWMKARVLAK
jgi:hypothetical protein